MNESAATMLEVRGLTKRCVGLGAVIDRKPPTLPFADLRRLELAKAIGRHAKLMIVDEPFAGLTASEVAAFSELIHEFRAEGRAVLLVDHSVKGVAALVDRVLAMYLGEWIAEGAAADVMRDETVRVSTLAAPSRARRDPRRVLSTRCRRCRSTTSASSTARRWRCRACRCTCTKASSCRWSA
jgi:branched-chain amino acid transport system ATP-binding protein